MNRRPTSALLAVLFAVAATQLVGMSPAAACSCDETPPVSPIDELGAAIIGEPVEVVGEVGEWQAVVRVAVTDVIKGQAHTEAFVLVKAGEDDCGPARFAADDVLGQPVGLQFGEGYPFWPYEDCSELSPDYILDGYAALDEAGPTPLPGDALPSTLEELRASYVGSGSSNAEAVADLDDLIAGGGGSSSLIVLGAVAVAGLVVGRFLRSRQLG